jgi:hypothetical protein
MFYEIRFLIAFCLTALVDKKQRQKDNDRVKFKRFKKWAMEKMRYYLLPKLMKGK